MSSKMSFMDLATVTLHRRNELEAKIKEFLNKCDHSIDDIQKLKAQAKTLMTHLNCEPSLLRERFLNCMNRLNEYTYFITDFNLLFRQLEESQSRDFEPDQDNTTNRISPVPEATSNNLLDVLTEPMPSTSAACSNLCPTSNPPRKKVPKKDQLLIAFSSTSSSSESVPQPKVSHKTAQSDLSTNFQNMTLDDPLSIKTELGDLPAQSVLQVEEEYQATIMSISDNQFWVIVDDIDEVYQFMTEMTSYYRKNTVVLSQDEILSLNYCAYYDDDSDCFYRALFNKLIEGDIPFVEVFLVDTGEVCSGPAINVQPLSPRFFKKPPFARCCYLAGIDILVYQDKELENKLELLMKDYVGTKCVIAVDDNTSESLGVYVILPSKKILNNIMISENLAVAISPPSGIQTTTSEDVTSGDDELDITDCPEYEDPVEAVTGYASRDDADICKHYKGGPSKTCFKGARCTKKHIMKHPDGWTLDKVEVPARITSVPLPPPGTWLRVLVTYVCHFDQLYVQIITDQEEERVPNFGVIVPPTTLKALVRDMNSPAARMSFKPLTISPAPGELVAALYPLDNQWYRARVVTVTRADQNVEVFYVDYGNVVWVKENEIRVLEPRFWQLPQQAVRCVLGGVKAMTNCSKQWAAAKQALANIAQDRLLAARTLGRGYDEIIIELYDEEGYSVAEKLAVLKLVNLKECPVIDDTRVTHKILPA